MLMSTIIADIIMELLKSQIIDYTEKKPKKARWTNNSLNLSSLKKGSNTIALHRKLVSLSAHKKV